MGDDPKHRHDSEDGRGKHYLIPQAARDPLRCDSVTTVLDLLDKASLVPWASGLAADAAFDSLPRILASQMVRPCGNTHNRCKAKHAPGQTRCDRCPCGDCEPCLRRWVQWRHAAESGRRADEGTEAHRFAQAWFTQGGLQIAVSEPVKPYVARFLEWAVDYGVSPDSALMTEATVYDEELLVAGTTDGAVWIGSDTGLGRDLCAVAGVGGGARASVRFDIKTREKPKPRLYNDQPLQLVGYEFMPRLLLPDGSTVDNPRTDLQAVLQLRPDGYTFRYWQLGPGDFNRFREALGIFRWMKTRGKELTDPVNPPPPRVVVPERLPASAIPPTTLRAAVLAAQAPEPAPTEVDPWRAADHEDPWADPDTWVEATNTPPEPPLAAAETDGWPAVAPIPAGPPDGMIVSGPPRMPDPFAAHTAPAQRAADGGEPTTRQRAQPAPSTPAARPARGAKKPPDLTSPSLRSAAGLTPLGPAQPDMFEEDPPF